MRLAIVIDKRVELSPKQIEEEKLEWSKLEFAFYVKEGENVFTRVSEPTYTDLMQESRRHLYLIVILFSFVIANDSHDAYRKNGLLRTSLCENGGQIIVIELPDAFNKEGNSSIILESNTYPNLL